jgi:uncharacterized membrane protein YesL
VWDHVFLVMGGSLLWAASLAVPVTASAFVAGTPLALPAYYLLSAVSVGPAWVALYGLSAAIARRELPGIGDFFATLRRCYFRAVGLFLAQAFLLGGFILAAWFYQTQFSHWALQVLSLLWAYVALFWAMMNLYAPAFLVRDDSSLRSALRKAAILTLAHPGYTFLVFLQVLALLALVAAPVLARANAALGVSFILFFLFLPGFVSLLATNAMQDLLRAHTASPADKGDETA